VAKKVLKKSSKKVTDPRYVIVRTQSAGVFFGELASKVASQVTLKNARRLWYWSGAASLSQLAMEGTKNPSNCKFPVAVEKQEILGVIEVLDTTVAAQESIKAVPVWSA
jgi:hypothetical protein